MNCRAVFLQLDVHDLLRKDNIQGIALHSQMSQQKRESQLNLFRCGKCPILLATDVVARGIHIKSVEYIINYDFPGSLEQVCYNNIEREYDLTIICYRYASCRNF